MSITTKTGDDGTTALFGGRRVAKYNLQIEACGSVDEVTSFIGLTIESISEKKIKGELSDIQVHLYLIMAYLSGATLDEVRVKKHLLVIEKNSMRIEKSLPKLTRFILPQGSEQTSRLHVARAMVRSSERRVAHFLDSKKERNDDRKTILKYLNRLSDLLFLYARMFDRNEQTI